MANIKQILVEAGEEPCKVDADLLHDALLDLPAHIYLDIHHKMQSHVTGLPFVPMGLSGGGCCVPVDNTAESKE